MRTASEGLLYDVLVAANQFPIIRAQYLDDQNIWQEFQDLLDVSVNEQGTKNDYSIFNYVPKVAEVSMTLQNYTEKYTPGAGGTFDGVIVKDRKIRVFMGYKVLEEVEQTEPVTTAEFNSLYHAQIIGSKIHAYTVAGITPSLTNFTVTSGRLTFDDTPPGSLGYWVNEDGDRVVNEAGEPTIYDNRPTFWAYALSDPQDTFLDKAQEINKINFDSDTDQIYVFYRTDDRTDDILTRNFKYAGQSASGSNSIDIPATTDRYIQVVFLWANDNYSASDEYIENVAIGYDDFSEYFDQGIFLVDTPNIKTSAGDYTISFSARDELKKAFENSISLPAYSGADVSQIIRDAADRLNIPWTTASLPTLSHTVTIAADDTWRNENGIDILNEVMVYVNAVIGNYFLVVRDGLLTLDLRAISVTNADYGLSTKDQLFSVNREGEEKNLLGKAIAQAKNPSTEAELLLDSSNYTATGQHVITYPAGSHTGKFFYVNVIVDLKTSDPSVYVEIISNTLTSMTYEIKGTGSVDVDVTIRGNEMKAPAVAIWETFAAINYVNKTGFTNEVENRLIQSDAEAKLITDKQVYNFGDQFFRVSVNGRGLPMLEIGDRVVVLDKKTNLNNILAIESINKKYTADGAVFNGTMTMRDSGWDLENWNYDRENVMNGGQLRGADDLKHDSNWFYDQDLSSQESDPTDYDYLKKLKAG